MEEELLSKKELLELTGISYGQLYRWKRKSLIPEEWFIRKATFTGQETYFPAKQILARIDRIKNMKDDLSLDELADVFSPMPANMTLTREELTKRNIVSKVTLDLLIEQWGDADAYPFDKVLLGYILEKQLQTGQISLDEGKTLLQTLAAHYPKFQDKPCELICVRKMGVSVFLLQSAASEIHFEPGARVVARLPLAPFIEELKLTFSQEGASADG